MEPEDVIRQLIRAGVKPHLVWAACRTGRLITGDMRQALEAEDLQEWEAALHEYRQKYPGDDWDMRNISEIIVRDKF